MGAGILNKNEKDRNFYTAIVIQISQIVKRNNGLIVLNLFVTSSETSVYFKISTSISILKSERTKESL